MAAADLEDREGTDSWTVGSRPPPGQALPPNASRVGAFAAAAGRSASAFVEAFRSVVGNHRRCAVRPLDGRGAGEDRRACAAKCTCVPSTPPPRQLVALPSTPSLQHLQHAPWWQRTLSTAAVAVAAVAAA